MKNIHENIISEKKFPSQLNLDGLKKITWFRGAAFFEWKNFGGAS